MLDDEEQKALATRMGKLFAERGLDVVFVGSTAVVGLGLYPRTSRDADALAPPGTTLDEARAILASISAAEGLEVVEKGWGSVALAKRDDEGIVLWEVDLLVPGDGPIPVRAAERIHAKAVLTGIGRTAIAEHVLASKAIAYGDCLGMGDAEGAQRYESDLLEFRRVLAVDFAWPEVERILGDYEDARASIAVEKIHEIFGRQLNPPR